MTSISWGPKIDMIGSTSAPFGHSLGRSFYHLELPLPTAVELESMNESEHNIYPLRAIGAALQRIQDGSEDIAWDMIRLSFASVANSAVAIASWAVFNSPAAFVSAAVRVDWIFSSSA